MIARYRKAIWALIGGATPAGVDAIIAAGFGVHLSPVLVAAISALLAAIATASSKPNAPKPQALRPTD